MDLLKDAEQKTSDIISLSLILPSPAIYNFRDYLSFDLGARDE